MSKEALILKINILGNMNKAFVIFAVCGTVKDTMSVFGSLPE